MYDLQMRLSIMRFEMNSSKLAQTRSLAGLGLDANLMTELELLNSLDFKSTVKFAKELMSPENRFSILMNI